MKSQKDPINEYIELLENKLEEERKVKERIKQDYEHKLREEGKKNNNLQKQNDRLKKEKDDIQKQYNSLLKENEQLKKEKEDIQSQIQEKETIISNQNETIENLYKEKNSMIEEFSKIKNENEILTNENQELKTKISNLSNAINVLSTKEEFLEKSEEQFYDVIIDINSINALLSKGWNIKYNQERKEIYEKIIQEETIKIGVLGLNNVGKSFILSSITKDTIPTGYSIETKGISIKYTEEEKGICLLDSAGFETPLLKNDFIIPSVINNNFNVNNNINNNNSINNNINNSSNNNINNNYSDDNIEKNSNKENNYKNIFNYNKKHNNSLRLYNPKNVKNNFQFSQTTTHNKNNFLNKYHIQNVNTMRPYNLSNINQNQNNQFILVDIDFTKTNKKKSQIKYSNYILKKSYKNNSNNFLHSTSTQEINKGIKKGNKTFLHIEPNYIKNYHVKSLSYNFDISNSRPKSTNKRLMNKEKKKLKNLKSELNEILQRKSKSKSSRPVDLKVVYKYNGQNSANISNGFNNYSSKIIKDKFSKKYK